MCPNFLKKMFRKFIYREWNSNFKQKAFKKMSLLGNIKAGFSIKLIALMNVD